MGIMDRELRKNTLLRRESTRGVASENINLREKGESGTVLEMNGNERKEK